MNIIETNYQWNGALSKRVKTDKIVLHHAAASSCSAEDVHRWHLSKGWCGIGYHYLVRKDGTIYRGRPENTVGAHAYGANSTSIGICFEGNFETEGMTDAQKFAGAELVADILNRYGLTATSVKKHSEINATACPGKNFPFDEIASGTVQNTSEPEQITASKTGLVLDFQKAAIADGFAFPKYGADGYWGTETSAVAKKAICRKVVPYKNINLTKIIQKAVGLSGKDIDGKFGSKTETAVKAFQKAHRLSVDGIVGLNTWKAILGV